MASPLRAKCLPVAPCNLGLRSTDHPDCLKCCRSFLVVVSPLTGSFLCRLELGFRAQRA